MVIKAVDYKEEEIGERIKMTKKRYTWVFEIDGKSHTVELHHSLLTGRIKVFSDGAVIFDEARFLESSFQLPFAVEVNMLNILQHGDTFELRINNQVFTHLYNQEKTRREFMKPDDPYFNKDEEVSKKDQPKDFWADVDSKENKKKPAVDDDNKFSLKFKGIDPSKVSEAKKNMGVTSTTTTSTKGKNDFADFGKFGDFGSFGTKETSSKDNAFAAPQGKAGATFEFDSSFGAAAKKPAPSANIDLLDLGAEPVPVQKAQSEPVTATVAPQQQAAPAPAGGFGNFDFNFNQSSNPPSHATPTNTPLGGFSFGEPAPQPPKPDNLASAILNAYNVPQQQPAMAFGQNPFNNFGAQPAGGQWNNMSAGNFQQQPQNMGMGGAAPNLMNMYNMPQLDPMTAALQQMSLEQGGGAWAQQQHAASAPNYMQMQAAMAMNQQPQAQVQAQARATPFDMF